MPELADQIDAIVKRFIDAGGKAVINSAIDLESCHSILDQSNQYDVVYPTFGIHPEVLVPGSDVYISASSTKWISKNLDQLHRLFKINSGKVVAVGECGLDYYWLKKEKVAEKDKVIRMQKDLLVNQISLAVDLDLPIVLHCRDEMGDKQCEAELLELVVKSGRGKLKGIFHSYTGSLSYLEDILNLGFYVSFNGIVTYKNADNVRELLAAVPDDRLLIESDSPLLSPSRERSMGIKVGEPAFVKSVGDFIAKRRGLRAEKLWEIIEKNFADLFRIEV